MGAAYIKVEIITNETIIQINIEQTVGDGTHQWELEIRKEDETLENRIRLMAAGKLMDALEVIGPIAKRTLVPPQ